MSTATAMTAEARRKLMSTTEAGRQTEPQVTGATVRRWATRGCGGRKLAARRVAGRYYVAWEDMEAFLAKFTDGVPSA
jgi:hypothetical protein